MEQEKLNHLKEKKTFVERVAHAICGQDRISVTELTYEVYESRTGNRYEELIKVTYDGGAIAVRSVFATSTPYIFKEIANLIDGGYYSEVKWYKELTQSEDYVKIL